MSHFLVHPQSSPLRGQVVLPSDKSISHRAIMIASIAMGTSTIERFSYGGDNVSTLRAFRAMGVEIEEMPGALRVQGVGLDGLRQPTTDLDCGNSGTTMRLLSGLLAGQTFAWTMTGDESLSKRPMKRVVGPLNARGAQIRGLAHGPDVRSPLISDGMKSGEKLGAATLKLPTPSAQVKSAMLLSGLYADGATHITEAWLSRDHSERLLTSLGAPLRTTEGLGGADIELEPAGWNRVLPNFSMQIPGDLSAAAFLFAAAAVVPNSDITLDHVGLNPTRAGILEWMRHASINVEYTATGSAGGEPVGALRIASPAATFGNAIAAPLAGATLVRAIDEVPAICVIAACIPGITEIRDATELRVKESDRIAACVRMLRAFGVECEERPDGLTIQGRPGALLQACEFDSGGDHRMAMSATLLGLRAARPSKILDIECVTTSFPGFADTLRSLGARVDIGS